MGVRRGAVVVGDFSFRVYGIQPVAFGAYPGSAFRVGQHWIYAVGKRLGRCDICALVLPSEAGGLCKIPFQLAVRVEPSDNAGGGAGE